VNERQVRVVVVGAGVAGTAAAIAAARAGADVTILDGGTGASTLATGALDFVPWSRVSETAPAISSEARAVLDALGAYVLGDHAATLLTSAGVVRPARGRDAALIDVAPLAGRRVGVVRCHRPGWDADALAKGWGSAFVAIDAQLLRHADERVLPDADFAGRHDEDARVEWLAGRLRDALRRGSEGDSIAGLVLPSALGVEHARARELSERTGIPCGEAITMPGGPSGLRFEHARDRALASAGVLRRRARATVARHEDAAPHASPNGAWRVSTEEGQMFESHAVVLASGGLLGGGIEYAPSDVIVAAALPPFAREPLRLSLAAPLRLGAFGRPIEVPGSLFGLAPESLAWPFAPAGLLDRGGVLVAEDGACVQAPRGLFAAGEVLADGPRTWLHALATGARAGAAAGRRPTDAPSPGPGPPIRP
jgi:glycerol-3-phosphate dehydrogenase subunit B